MGLLNISGAHWICGMNLFQGPDVMAASQKKVWGEEEAPTQLTGKIISSRNSWHFQPLGKRLHRELFGLTVYTFLTLYEI